MIKTVLVYTVPLMFFCISHVITGRFIKAVIRSCASLNISKNIFMENDKFGFAIDRGGTFTDIYARCPGGKIRVMKLLSVDPDNYKDAPREGIRRVLEEV